MEAKKVKFAVDMDTITINSTGVHVVGDFQLAAGYTADWDATLTQLTKEQGTNIYSIVVDIPAFHKYEYKFVNGDQLYNVEIVPEKSRVGYSFNDDRWLYVDSTTNDTTFVGAIVFEHNAPAGKLLLRCKVNMKNSFPLSNGGVHLSGSFMNWSLNDARLYSFVDSVYENIVYVDSGDVEYKFYNGNISINAETVPSTCATNNNRSISVSNDTVLVPVCFASCITCFPTAIASIPSNGFTVTPNPANDFIAISFNKTTDYFIQLNDVVGRTIFATNILNSNEYHLERNAIPSGLYFLTIFNQQEKKFTTQKIVFQ
jgi:hypothetical protein